MAIANLGDKCYPSEPILVPSQDNPEPGGILTVVFNGDTNTREVRIYQSDRLGDEPICRLALPTVIPPGFHGTWQQN